MFVFVLFALVASATAHKFGGGGCTKVQPVEGFDMEKFQGKWYVMKKLKTSISCVINHFSSLPEAGTFNYTETQQIWGQLLTKEATLKTEEGNLIIDYPLFFPDSSFDVIDTDYDTYAIIHKCQPLPFSHRWSASILSRDPGMPKSDINDHLETLADYVNISEMDDVDHTSCVTNEEAMVDIAFGPEMSIKPRGQVVRSLINGFKGLSGAMKMEGADSSSSEEDNPDNEVENLDLDFF